MTAALRLAYLFDSRRPTVTEVKDQYGSRFVDLSKQAYLSGEDVANAVLTLKQGYALILPDLPYWDRSETFKKGNREVPLNTSFRFKKFGPEVNLTASRTTAKEMKGKNWTPRKAMKETLSGQEVEDELLYDDYRGFGWWEIGTRTHRIMPFDLLAEGDLFYRYFKDPGIHVTYQHADSMVVVPSFSREGRNYEITLRVLPVTEGYLVEWTKTRGDCQCEDSKFREIRGKYWNADDKKYETVFKYANPEYVDCKHTFAARLAAEDVAGKNDRPPILVKWPRATGLLNPWHNLKTRTLLANGNKLRRPLKSEMSIICGKILAYAGAEEMLDLKE